VIETGYGAALLLGLLGGSHCLFMCGGISAALGVAADSQHKTLIILLFQLGRITSYTLLGAGLGAILGLASGDNPTIIPILRLISGLLLISMGCYLANWWHGLQWIERAGQGIWRRVQPLVQKLLPLARVRNALLVGLCWGLLPCGLIYTALAWSATAAHWLQSATLMFCFGLGTLPVMFATGIAGEKLAALLRKKALRNIAAVLLISFGGWTATTAVMQALPGSGASAHQHH
jgi:sulfite exporter TauE/SafE